MKEKIQNVCEKLLTSIRKNAIILQTNKQTNKQTIKGMFVKNYTKGGQSLV